MKTYQDLQKAGTGEDLIRFLESAIQEHKNSDTYRVAEDAEAYYRHENPTISKYEKIIYNLLGQAVRDPFSPNHKILSNWYFYFTTQAVQYLLGNGAMFQKEDTKQRLGKDFDAKLQQLAVMAKNGGAAYGFFNNGRVDAFSVLEFVPLLDEEDGGLKAGIRFWQVDETRPLRAVLYELGGYTSFIRKTGEKMTVLKESQKYIETVNRTELLGEEILDGRNYPGFPIVPLYNTNRKSELCGNQGTIDAYDLLSSKFVNNVSEGDLIYWIIQNCGGMDDMDDVKFLERLRTLHVAHADGGDGAKVDAHTLETPYEANKAVLEQLKSQLFHDFMALNTQEIQSGNVTATQIQAAYEPLNQKTDLFEYSVISFVEGILQIAGIEDEVSFTRSQMSNETERTEMVMMAAEYLDDETILQKLPWVTPEEAKEILRKKDADELDRFNSDDPEDSNAGTDIPS